jgi:hypothetical protein
MAMERKVRVARLSGVYLVVVAAVLVTANVLAYGLNARLDMTKNERFTLSQGSARLVREGLKDQLTVKLYVSRGLPKLDVFVEDLTDLMREYEQASAGKFKYLVIEPKTDEERQQAKDAGLQEAAFGEGSETGDKTTMTQGYMGVVFEYGSEREVIPILHPEWTQGLEFWITNKIREIRDRADDLHQKIGAITKDGIKITDQHLIPPQGGRPGPSIKSILDQALPFYKIEDVDLKGGDEEIDKDLRGVIVLQADGDWTDKELARLDQFLMRGDKALLVVAGAVNMKPNDAAMKAELSTRGLDKLLAGYGIKLHKDAVLDWGRSMRIPVPTQLGSLEWYYAPGVLQLQHDAGAEENEQILDNAFPGFFRLEELAFPFPSSLELEPDKQPGARMKVVARTSPNTTVDTAERMDMSLRSDWRPKGEAKQRAIAASVEGKLKSAFADKDKVEGVEVTKESPADSRVLVIASPQFLANPFSRAGNPPPLPPQMAMFGNVGGDPMLMAISGQYARKYLTQTILAFKNLLDWMCNDRDLIAVSAKLIGDSNLSYEDITKPRIDASKDDEAAVQKKVEEYRQQRQGVQQKVQWTLTLLPPILFAALGIGRWRLRESRRETVRVDAGGPAPAKKAEAKRSEAKK